MTIASDSCSVISFREHVIHHSRAMFRKRRETEYLGITRTVPRLLQRRSDCLDELARVVARDRIPGLPVAERIHTAVAIASHHGDA
jgi:hypothetical protein